MSKKSIQMGNGVKKIPMRKQLREQLDAARDERMNSLSRTAFDIFRMQLELAMKAENEYDRRQDLKLADAFFFNVIRAEKNEDTELLMELQRQLEELQDTSAGSLEDL